MKIIEIKNLVIEDIKVIKYEKFPDIRGYFTETYRKSIFNGLNILAHESFVQSNESYSKKGVIRGLHFQWNPYMSKLVRTIRGHMIDMILDIRKGSDTYGCLLLYDMKAEPEVNYSEWIWIPPGFAHGNFFLEETTIEYYCSGLYNSNCEASISPLSRDLDWRLADKKLAKEFERMKNVNLIISEKDKGGFSMSQWRNNKNFNKFVFSK